MFNNNQIPFETYPLQDLLLINALSVDRFGGDEKLQIAYFLSKLCLLKQIGFFF